MYGSFPGQNSTLRGCPESRLPDRIHFLDDRRWIRRSRQFLYCPESRGRQSRTDPQRLPQRHDHCSDLGSVLHLPFDRMPGAYFPCLYHRGRRSAHGRGLSGDPWRLSAIYECRDHDCRGFRRFWKNRAAICCKHRVYRHPHSAGAGAGTDGSRTKRDLVEHHHFQHFQRNHSAVLVFDLSQERITGTTENFLTRILFYIKMKKM